MTQQAVISAPGEAAELDIGGHRALHRIRSIDTAGVFSVLEMIIEPGEGAEPHTHTREDELVHVVEGEVEVTLGDQTMVAAAGVIALLPRGVPHGYVNRSDRPCRIIDVILPGGGDAFFAGVHDLLQRGVATPHELKALMSRFAIRGQ